MIFRNRAPIRRTGKGVVVELGDGERDLLRLLTEELQQRLAEGGDAPDLRRLYPTAYHDDPERDAEYQILARSELTDGRLAALRTMQATLDANLLGDDDLGCWMTSINQMRLVLGTRLDIGEDDDDEAIDPSQPEGQDRLIYHWLTSMLAMVVDASRP